MTDTMTDPTLALTVKATVLENVPEWTINALQELPCIVGSKPNQVIGVARSFNWFDEDEEASETSAPSFILNKDGVDAKWVAMRDLPDRENQMAGAIAYTAFKDSSAFTNWAEECHADLHEIEYSGGLLFEVAAIVLRNAAVFFEKDFMPDERTPLPKGVTLLERKGVAVAIPDGLSNHERLRALEGAGEFLSRALREHIDPNGIMSREQRRIKVVL